MENYEAYALSSSCQITKLNTGMTLFSAIMRFMSIMINWYLAFDYAKSESYVQCYWTIASILVPMFLTTLIYSNILIESNLGRKTVNLADHIWKLVLSYLFRDAITLSWAFKYYQAKEHGDKVAEIEFYHRHCKEDCNVGFLRLFDSFLESAPQKVLQLAILLRSIESLTYLRAITLTIYFLSIAWCLVAYNRSNRSVQLDKYDIGTKGVVVQFWYLLCLTSSRTIFLAYMASKFPMETLAGSLIHVFLCGTIVFALDKPKFGRSAIVNYILCLTFGVVYMFVYTPVRDAPTRNKYTIYLTFCLLQTIIVCALYIPLYISMSIISFYIAGIALMIYYYLRCHPGIVSAVF